MYSQVKTNEIKYLLLPYFRAQLLSEEMDMEKRAAALDQVCVSHMVCVWVTGCVCVRVRQARRHRHRDTETQRHSVCVCVCVCVCHKELKLVLQK